MIDFLKFCFHTKITMMAQWMPTFRKISLLALFCLNTIKCLCLNWPEITIDGQVMNTRIVLPGVELDEGLNLPEKEKEIMKYMATVPELHRQQSVLKQTEDSARADGLPAVLESSQINRMRDDFLLIKEDLKNLQEAKFGAGTSIKSEENFDLAPEIEKFQNHFDELNRMISSISLVIQRKLFRSKLNQKEILNSLQLMHPKEERRIIHSNFEIPPRSKQKTTSAHSFEIPKLGRDEVELIEDHIPRILANELASLLENISPFKLDQEIQTAEVENVLALRLQSIVFQAIHYLYKYKFIARKDVKDLFVSNNILELAVINMVLMFKINVGFEKDIPMSSKEILKSHHSSHFRSLFEVLDDKKRREISYGCLKLVYHHHTIEASSKYLDKIIDQKRMRDVMDLFLKDDQLFKFLEQDIHAHHPQSFSKSDVIDMKDYGPIDQFEIVKELQDLKIKFLAPGPEIYDDINLTIQFLVLSFVKENYNSFFLELQEDNTMALDLKLNLISSGFHLHYEFKNIRSYLKLFINRIDPQFHGFKYFQVKRITKQEALRVVELMSRYIFILSFKHDQYISDFKHNLSMEKYLQIIKLNQYIRFTQIDICVTKFKVDNLFD
ncbi:hypothetical protein PGT21_031976 [Puccinia graminis f. sp. tritici]|uniref:Uncharacterized protein n=1 Tax=Puccinia graminis f. sp. tritici TaxID=56615 RepID=A0A5B0QXS1_PUCGR|nr:hypothetical protein PGT21_031976 [Puccinia graminis f. sp. tritici]